jgi:hypothetical protein
MLPAEARPGFSALYNDRHPSISLWTISLALSRRSREFGVRRYSTAILPAWVMALADNLKGWRSRCQRYARG